MKNDKARITELNARLDKIEHFIFEYDQEDYLDYLEKYRKIINSIKLPIQSNSESTIKLFNKTERDIVDLILTLKKTKKVVYDYEDDGDYEYDDFSTSDFRDENGNMDWEKFSDKWVELMGKEMAETISIKIDEMFKKLDK